MAEFQIVLLPRNDYWEWVRACQDYALAFGVNFTSDPAVAGRMMAPRQVITFPDFPEGYSESKDMVGWYQKRFPGIRLDAVGVSSPAKLAREFKKRIKAKDRYGQRLRPFYLLWPTDYPVVTQTFGANPQIYQRYGLPGHEGLDMRALTNTNIYAAFDGEVYEVFRNAKAHAYGIHIRLRHRDGYKTVYAHLAKPLVVPGQVVKGGELIGKADSTGASTGAHLHLTLKRDAATARGETRYPKDIIDPTPYIVWPEGYRLKSVQAKNWPTDRCLVGAVARIGGPPRSADLDLVARARLEAVSIDASTPDETIGELRRLHPGIVLMGAVGGDFDGESIEVNAFLDTVMGDARRLVRQGVRNLELLSAPNLQSGGWCRSWYDGRTFAAWWLEAAAKLRAELPEVRLGFPGLDPGGDIGGWRAADLPFLEQAGEAADSADWIGVHAYWEDEAGLRSFSGGRRYVEVLDRFPDQRLVITRFANPRSDVAQSDKARQYLAYYRQTAEEPAIAAALCCALSAERGYQDVCWRREDGTDCGYADSIGDRQRLDK